MFPSKSQPKKENFPVEATEVQRQHGQVLLTRHDHIDIGSFDPRRRWD